MKKKTLSFLLAMTVLTLSACGTSAGESSDTGVESSDTDNESGETSNSDTSVGNDSTEETAEAGTGTETDESTMTVNTSSGKFSVTYEEKTEEITADDGTVLVNQSIQTPVIASEEAGDTAAKINADISAFLASTATNDEVEQWAREVYEDSASEEGGIPFNAYSNDVYTGTKRMDDNVISFEITYYSYAGGAHGNYSSVGRSYSAQTGDQIFFDDLSDDMDAFRSAASDYLIALAQSPSYNNRLFPNMDNESIESTLFAENKWFFSNEGITFISDPYALGPYAEGTLYFTIPYGEAVNMGLKEAYDYLGNYTQERYYTYAYDENGNPGEASGDTEYTFDLNGDGTDETIAFYGFLSSEDGSSMSLYINGKQLGETIAEQIDPSTGYLDRTYVLYDLDPADDFIEIGVLFSVIDSSDKPAPYTYFFRYTTDNELIYLGKIEGYASGPEADFDSLEK